MSVININFPDYWHLEIVLKAVVQAMRLLLFLAKYIIYANFLFLLS